MTTNHTTDKLTVYREMRAALKAELDAHLKAAEEIQAELDGHSARESATGKPAASMSLRAAIEQVTRNRPMTKAEILEAVQKIGYRFNTKKPMTSIDALIYKKSNGFKRQNGRFSPK